MGAEKLVQKFDEKMAAEAGLQFKPLTTSAIEKHLADFGIEPEDASHTLIKSLSGGQKIKVAIHDYKGGVIIISHNREFAGAVCQEKWIMDKGHLRREGESVTLHEEEEVKEELGDKVVIDALGNEIKSVAMHEEEEKKEELGDKVVIDALGNEIKVNKQTQLSDKDKKKEIKRIQKMITDGRKKKTLNEDTLLDLELKLEELKVAP
eukprot:evm.model.NODE_36558_length_9878_cov_24.109232.5